MYRRSGITKPAGFDVFHSNKSCVVFFLYTSIFFYFVYLGCFFTVDFVVRISMSLPRLPHHCYVPVIYHVLSFFTLMLLLLIYYWRFFLLSLVFLCIFSIWIIMKLQTCHKNNKNCLYLNVSVIIDNFCLF